MSGIVLVLYFVLNCIFLGCFVLGFYYGDDLQVRSIVAGGALM